MRRRSRYGWLELIEGILLILLGIYTLINPGNMIRGVTVVYGFFGSSYRNFRYCILCENRPLYWFWSYHFAGFGNP